MAHLYDHATYVTRQQRREAISLSRPDLSAMPGQAQQHAANAAASNSVPALQQVVAQQAAMLERLTEIVDLAVGMSTT